MFFFKPKKIALVVTCLLSLFLISGCSVEKTQVKAPEPEQIKMEKVVVAIPVKGLNSGPILFGMKKGFFEQEGLGLELVTMESQAAITGLITGEVDFDLHTSALRAGVSGMPIRMIGYQVSDITLDLYANPKIKTVEDLAGKNVAVSDAGGNTTYLVNEILRQNGVTGVKLLTVGSTNRLPALISGQIDATLLNPEQALLAEKEGMRLIAKGSDYAKMGLGGISTSLTILEKQPDIVKKLLRATIKSAQYIKQNKQEVVDFIVAEFEFSKEDAQKIYDRYNLAWSGNLTIDEQAIKNEIELEKKAANVTGEIGLDQVRNFQLLEKVQKELGL